jgi:hypothetical protein
VILLVIGIAALLSLLLFIRIPSPDEWIRVSLDAAHGPIFAAVAVLVAVALQRTRGPAGAAWPDWPVWRRALAISVALGVAIEILQGFEGRPPSVFDVATDLNGALAGLAAWTLATRPDRPEALGMKRDTPWLAIALGLAGLTFVLWRPFDSALAYAQRSADFPVIAAFDHADSLHFATTDGVSASIVELPPTWATIPGERALELRYDPSHPPAVQILEPSPDWRGYDVLVVDLTNSGAVDLSLVLRIHDVTHDWTHEDRANLPLVVPARRRTSVRVALDAVEHAPAARRMDLARIDNVMVFGRPPAGQGALYVSGIRLERGAEPRP